MDDDDRFNVKLKFPVTERSCAGLKLVEPILEQNLRHRGSAPWERLRLDSDGWVVCADWDGALETWLQGDARPLMMKRTMPCCDASESLHLSRDAVTQQPTLSLYLSADPRLRFRLFGLICVALDVREACYVPDTVGRSRSQHWLLRGAIERDFALMSRSGFDMPAVHALAERLPHMRSYKPEGTKGEPARLGWLNFWSAPVAQLLGFPDAALGDDRFKPLVQGDDGSWYFALTPQPLDLSQPAHVEALVAAYERFPTIGRRYTAGELAAKKAAKSARRRAKTAANAKQDRIDAILPQFQIRLANDPGARWRYQPGPIAARDPEDALKIFFARATLSRRPKPRESLRVLASKYDEMAETTGEPKSALLEAVLSEIVAAPAPAAVAMPAREIAEHALGLWDMLATEMEGPDELHEQVVADLIDVGVDPLVAEETVELIEPALATRNSEGELPSPELMRNPIFVALLEAAKSYDG